ncbi:MAG: hypothetical protein HY331_19270 [Chloroflexi bacterium]|nr:hypothetical protein [Chloroflexota bacterium]
MNVMRYTVLDRRGGVSFIGACEALRALVAGCSADPRDLDGLLAEAARYYPTIREYVLSGLAIFDEHNVPDNYAAIHEAIRFAPAVEVPVFRIGDDLTLKTSLQPIKAGVILFNLPDRRIVQIQNSYAEIERAGRIRVPGTLFTRPRVFPYRLPAEWSIVP